MVMPVGKKCTALEEAEWKDEGQGVVWSVSSRYNLWRPYVFTDQGLSFTGKWANSANALITNDAYASRTTHPRTDPVEVSAQGVDPKPNSTHTVSRLPSLTTDISTRTNSTASRSTDSVNHPKAKTKTFDLGWISDQDEMTGPEAALARSSPPKSGVRMTRDHTICVSKETNAKLIVKADTRAEKDKHPLLSSPEFRTGSCSDGSLGSRQRWSYQVGLQEDCRHDLGT
ncbi:hypothetical protein BJV77DRAFT_578830 [Russula vinacea]|nr:hypothetical protein BJV77DRAFT_578830 [Russula vinacea]